jgi:hypothetical protein
MRKKNPHAVALGRLGGKFKGKKGLASMTPKRRAEIQALGVAARQKGEECQN